MYVFIITKKCEIDKTRFKNNFRSFYNIFVKPKHFALFGNDASFLKEMLNV